MENATTLDLTKYIDTYLFGDRPHIRGRAVLVSEIVRNARREGHDTARLAARFGVTERQAMAALLYDAEHGDELHKQYTEQEDSDTERAERELKVKTFDDAITRFREGLTDEELDEILADAVSEYVDPDDLTLFDWIDDLPEHER